MTDILTAIVTSVPWWLRLTLAIALIGGGGGVLWYVSLRIGVLLVGAGTILLCFSEKTKAEKSGYRF